MHKDCTARTMLSAGGRRPRPPRLPRFRVTATAILVLALAGRVASAQNEFEGWHLEPGLDQAHLVMVARVASISRVTVVEGAKTDVALREYRFGPVRILKGIFQREELSMTASDLGIPSGDASQPPPVREGEFRLLILTQRRGAAEGCVSAAPGARTFAERVPLVAGPEDPLVSVVETLIQLNDSRSRRDRARLLIQRLADVRGLPAVPVLSSLRLRADWAATDPQAYTFLATLARDPAPAVRAGAVVVLGDMLAARTLPDDPRALETAAAALRALLDSDEAVTATRLAALDALGHLLALSDQAAWPRELLIEQLTSAATHAERAAAATALARISHPQAVAAVLDALAKLPLDEPPPRELAYARAAARLDAAAAEPVLLARLERSIAARQLLAGEIEPLGQMGSRKSVPLLLAAAGQLDTARRDRAHIAQALGHLGDDRAVPVLIDWLRANDSWLKKPVLASLERLDSQLAAREARPLLKSEPHLPNKLRLARLLARHGFADGYALATEHLADAEHTAAAALVLAALDDPRTADDLSEILAARPDRRWQAAALTGLAAVGDPAAGQRLLEILADDRHPLVADAAQAAGLSTDSALLLPLAKLVTSRNIRIARASLVAARRFLSGVRTAPRGLAAAEPAGVDLDEFSLEDVGPEDADLDDAEMPTPAADVPPATRAALSEAAARLAADSYVEASLRQEALAVARLLGGDDYARLLAKLADQAELEGTPLLAEVQAERRRLSAREQQR